MYVYDEVLFLEWKKKVGLDPDLRLNGDLYT